MVNVDTMVASLPEPKGEVLIEPFDYRNVRLSPSRFRDQVDEARRTYGALANDDILHGFRREAGLPHPGKAMRGWCSATSAVIFGQILSGLVRVGRATGDRALIEKAVALFAGWRATLSPDGNARMRLYDWEKLVCGLVDLYAYAGLEEALDALRLTTAWASRTFDRTRARADGHDFWGAGPGDTSEWYTLPENLFRAYLLSGDPAFRAFAQTWLYEEYWEPFARTAAPERVDAVHAYSHVNSFSSAAMAYRVGGAARYLTICENGYDFLQASQCYATGGFGPDERLMPPDGSLGRSLAVNAHHAEIPCGAWAAFKLSRDLIGFTGKARFGDWIETTMLNAMAASLPLEPDGRAFYYGDYSISAGRKTRYWHEWPCCSGTYIQNMAEYHNLIFFRDAGGLFVNLFIPAELTFSHAGVPVELRQETGYPEAETVRIAVDPAEPVEFALRIRVPGWADRTELAVNGEAVPVTRDAGGWAVLARRWEAGDAVVVRLPMALRAVPVDRQHPHRVAILYGPTVLAQDEACCRRPFAIAPQTKLETRLVKEDGRIRFRILNTVPERHTRYLVPLYTLPADWPYWVYFDLHEPPLY